MIYHVDEIYLGLPNCLAILSRAVAAPHQGPKDVSENEAEKPRYQKCSGTKDYLGHSDSTLPHGITLSIAQSMAWRPLSGT